MKLIFITTISSILLIIVVSSIFVFSTQDRILPIESNIKAVAFEPDLIAINISFPPTRIEGNEFEFESKAGLLFDLNSRTTLLSKNPKEKMPIASLTKIMTAIVTLRNLPLDETVITPDYVRSYCGSCMYLNSGEEIDIETLLQGLLINSANDAAKTIEFHYNQDSSRNLFVDQMNDTAKTIGMKNSNFDNPVGLDSENNYSTAEDMKALVTFFLGFEKLEDIVRTKDKSVYGKDNTYHYLKTTNKLILDGYPYIYGVKTGTTDNAGESFIFSYEYDDHVYIGILLNSPDRFEEAKRLIGWIQASYE